MKTLEINIQLKLLNWLSFFRFPLFKSPFLCMTQTSTALSTTASAALWSQGGSWIGFWQRGVRKFLGLPSVGNTNNMEP